MDFTTIRGRLDAGGYGGWDALADDMATMFANAMAFNRPDTVFHKQARARGRRAPALGAAGARKMPLRALPGAARAPGGACGARQQPCAWQDARTDKAVHGRDSGRVLACSLWSRQSPAMPLARTRLAGAPADARARAARPRRWRA